MELPDLIKPVYDRISTENRRFPCYTNRASSLGYAVPELNGCLRRGVLSRTKWEEAEAFDQAALLRLREGNNQEAIVLRDMAAAGIVLVNQQEAYEWREYQISGHLDATVIVEGKAVPVEIKSMSPNIFSSVSTFDDLNKKSWLRSYKCQITLYQLHKNIDKAIMILKDKSSGGLKQLNIDLDYQLGEYCIRAAEKINKHVADKTLPDRIPDVEICAKCPFRLVCCPGMVFGVEAQIGDDPAFESRLDKHFELQSASKEYDDNYKVIRERCVATAKGQPLKIVCGKYIIEGRFDARKSFRLDIQKP